MRRLTTGLIGLGLTASFGVAYAAPGQAAPAPQQPAAEKAQREHDLPNPLEDKRRALREEALSSVLSGDAKTVQKNGSTVVKLGKAYKPADAAAQNNAKARTKLRAQKAAPKQVDQYVELEQERADKVFVILAEFGDERHPDFPDSDWASAEDAVEPQRFDGPLHNQIPEPDRRKDNTTIWQKDFSQQHFDDMYFADGKKDESLKTYYETQSSGRYTVDGEVSDWVKVRYNQARYGRTDEGAWDLVRDALNQWVADREAAGATPAEIKAELAEYDQYDRYDFDGDGDFNEPDGYVDHFQIVHAGGDEADGDPTYGSDALWSHRWYAFVTDAGATGPATNPLGGTQVGDTGIWVGDYTVQPENGGLSVFAHEYGHDLGLPDAYSTSGGDNNNEYWTLMAQSRLSGKGEPLGTRPGDLGAWEKLQLGWLDYEAVTAKQKKTLELGPQEYNTDKAQGAVVVLPKKSVTKQNGAPASGKLQFHSGSGDDLANSMTTEVDLTGKTTASFTGKVRYAIEAGYDYAYIQASTDGGDTWTSLPGTVGGKAFGLDTSKRPALGGEQKTWADLNVPLDAYAGQKIQLRAYYKTDGGLALAGLFLDDLSVVADGQPVLTDGAEDGSPAWTFDGFQIIAETTTTQHDNFYVMGNRSHVSYDKYLATGPYNFGWLNTRPDWAEHFSYGQGLLISYWDTSQADNNTIDHPGQGRNLPIDAHPEPIINIANGQPWRARVAVYDAPFSLQKASSFTLHTNGVASYIRAQNPQPTFDDTKKYWYAETPQQGVKLPGAGVKVKVVQQQGTSLKIKVN